MADNPKQNDGFNPAILARYAAEKAAEQQAERDALVAPYQQRIATLEAKNAQLRAALQGLEWVGVGYCWKCGWGRAMGHQRDCPIGQALADDATE